MMEKPPRVSVLIPSYNHERFLPEAVESVLMQEFDDYEILIIDDNSSDGTIRILEHYADLDDRIRFSVNSANIGVAENWNKCLMQARGEYIKLLNSDDILVTPLSLQKLAGMLDDNPGAVIASSARYMIDEDSKVLEKWDTVNIEGCFDGRKTILRCLRENANIIGEPSAVLFRKSFAARGFDTAFKQITDLDLWFHLLEQGDMVYTREPLAAWRNHTGNLTRENARQNKGEKELLSLMFKYLYKPWVPSKELLRALYNRLYSMRILRDNSGQAGAIKQCLINEIGRFKYSVLYVSLIAPYAAVKTAGRIKRRLSRIRTGLSKENEPVR